MSIPMPEHYLTVLKAKLTALIEQTTAYYNMFYPFTFTLPLIDLINTWKHQEQQLDLIIVQMGMAQMSLSYPEQGIQLNSIPQTLSAASQNENTPKAKSKKRYSPEEKQRAVQLFKEGQFEIDQISKRLEIPACHIKRWASEEGNNHQRKRMYIQLEKELFIWMKRTFSKGQNIEIAEIQQQAIRRSKYANFKASLPWAEKFIECYNLRKLYKIE